VNGQQGGDGGVGKQFLDVRTITTLPYKIGLGAGYSGSSRSGGITAFGADNDSDANQPTFTITVTAGAIATIAVTNGGTGFTVAPLVQIQQHYLQSNGVSPQTPKQGGIGATATATINGSGVLTAITVTNGGSGYTQNEVEVFMGLCGGHVGAGGAGGSVNMPVGQAANGAGHGNTNGVQNDHLRPAMFGPGKAGGTTDGQPSSGFAHPGAIIIKSYK
jgi:hypothetical protein